MYAHLFCAFALFPDFVVIDLRLLFSIIGTFIDLILFWSVIFGAFERFCLRASSDSKLLWLYVRLSLSIGRQGCDLFTRVAIGRMSS